ncbi:unnamed protein product [Lactuca saligna]|uniref:SWIM-type domain-containing protein n=1 Tax=Lactuca saligna TaxID=75948 RepID=A0AA36A355_LACSI|nr:unnamed protein product [Lactuca saligna]
MVLCMWNLHGPHTIAPDLDKDYSKLFNFLLGVSWCVYSKLIGFSFSNGHENIFTLKIHHGGFFTKFPGRKYVEERLAFFDFVDTDLFSVHDLNDMIREIGYSADDTMYYHYRIPNLDLDFGLKALGNDQDVISMAQYIPQNRVINVYVEHGSTRLHTYFMSPSKVVIKQLDDDPSPELNRIRPKNKGIGSCRKKLDMNVPLKESANQAQIEDSVYDFSMSLVPFETNKQDVVNDFKDEEDEKGHAEDSKDDSEEHTEEEDDSDYIVDPEAILDDWEVDMREFTSCVDEVEWFGQGPNIELKLNQDDDLCVINNDEFEDAGYEEDLRKRMLKNLNKKVPCSYGVVHVTPFFVGQAFKTKNDIQSHIKMISIKTRRALHMAKNEKLRVRVKCKGVVPDSTDGGPSTLQTNNPSTIVKREVCNEPNLDIQTRIFKRIYICLGAFKLGFKSGKRELLGLDGCFLKGPHPGQILTVVGLDSNNGIYPLAYSVVEAEITSSYTWFLKCLGGDLDLDASCNFTFVSDRQKLQWREEEFRDHLWRCATNITIRHFERAMNEFKDFSEEAHERLSKIPPVHWGRSHFSGRAHSDCLLNNLCEVFNSKLEHGRDKPIITCLEYIRVYLMKRHCIVQKEIDKCKSILTPTTTTLLDTIKTVASKYKALFCADGTYQVTGMMFDQYVVNLKEGTCSCRYWEITGIVCRHGVCAIWEHIQNGEKAQQPEY